jgi:hypothetical protein
MKGDQFGRLMHILRRLDEARISYQMQHSRDDALMVLVYAPGQYWEVEFLQDGDIDIERYKSNGHIDDESVLPELFALCSDEEATPASVANQDGTTP